eukprot:TRINITY_DN4071_c0_g1_i1.p1 TRINITY_DN4071_c0_g1~~TRINITY_DN4071_c0_g1_i1.p1  ORF type:complete len:148 (+),score=11.08 TRINITY_DN4071_c0_g1_i1:124-567(+)
MQAALARFHTPHLARIYWSLSKSVPLFRARCDIRLSTNLSLLSNSILSVRDERPERSVPVVSAYYKADTKSSGDDLRSQFKALKEYLQQLLQGLFSIKWPNLRETASLTLLVSVVIFVLMVMLSTVDSSLSFLLAAATRRRPTMSPR